MSLLNDAKRPVPKRPPLADNPRRKYGSQRAPLVPCHKPTHGFHPADESCPDCVDWLDLYDGC
jgi:hypothetical protein